MVAELVGRARRRYLWNELLAQGAWAVSAALAALIILLLLGTQILDWRWLVALPAAALAGGLWRTVRRMPTAYTVAQVVDQRLKLADALSTAIYFAGPDGRADAGARELQRSQAERISAHVNVREAVPFAMPRAIYSMAILGVAASSLFALRYGIDQRLDLEKPLASIIQQALGLDEQQAAALERQKPPSPQKEQPFNELQGLSAREGEGLPEGKLEGVEAIDASGAPAPEKIQAAAREAREGGTAGDELAEEFGDQMAGFSTGASEGQGGQGGERQGQQSAAQQKQGDNAGSSSLLDKFREAMQNLMSRMRQPQSSQGGATEQAGNQDGRQSQQQAGAGQSREGQQQSGGQSAEGQEGQPGGEPQSAENSSGRGTGRSGQENPQQPGSGIGTQDGDKGLRTAEQLAAMGKISEIIGKRSANVTGEVTVEVQSSSQQLQTPYQVRRATQGEAIAEISRDEVPVALESYVQQYFERLHSTPAAKR